MQALEQNELYVQDMIHILTKLRTRYLNSLIELKMGKYVASADHLRNLISTTSKQTHGLCLSDLNLQDEMNYKSAEKIYAANVISNLYDIDSSHATIVYLQIMQDLISAFLDQSIVPTHRVHLIWKCVLFLRVWRDWLVTNKYKLGSQFVTSNCYTCIELNAHAIVAAIIYCRENDCADLFIPWLFSSQSCEKFFRTSRSMTSTLSTVVNFSILEFSHRINRIFFQSEIEQELHEKYIFPRFEERMKNGVQKKELLQLQRLPTNDELLECINLAWSDVLEMADFVGMPVKCREKPYILPNIQHVHDITRNHDSEEDEEASREASEEQQQLSKNHAELSDEIQKDLLLLATGSSNVNSRVNAPQRHEVLYTDEKGHVYLIKKTTACWLLEEDKMKLSSDRNERVKAK